VPELKLLALEPEDMTVISAHVQDAVMRVGDLAYLKSEGRFACVLNRFAWEEKGKQRRRSGLDFARVLNARLSGIDLKKSDEVMNLLAITFEPSQAPSGVVQLIFSGEKAIALEVECLEARLQDLGGAWEAGMKPRHPAR
jgi:hypothetical protein